MLRVRITGGTLYAAILAVLSACFSAPAGAAAVPSCPTPPPLTLQQDPQWIHRGFQALFDPARPYELSQVLAPAQCSQFRAVRGPANFGYRADSLWLRFSLPSRLQGETGWRALVLYGLLDRVCMHWPVTPAPQYQSQCADHGQPMDQGARASPGWYFAVPTNFDSSRAVLLQAQSKRVVNVQLAVGTADGFVKQLYRRQAWIGSFYGLMLGMMLFGLVMYFAQRDAMYLYFFASMALFTLFIIMDLGQGSPLGLVGYWTNFAMPLVIGLNVMVSTLFYQRFVDSARYAPRLHRALLWLAIAYLAVSIAALVLPLRLAIPVGLVFALPWLVVLPALLLVRLRQGFHPALYPLLAWTCFGVAGFLRSLDSVGLVLLPPQITNLIFSAGELLLSMLLAAGLYQRMRALARERDQARELAVSSQKLALYRAHYDPVTHLPNRARFREHLQEQLLQRSSDHGYALITLGLDRFGLLNDAMGHDIGDSVLGEIGKRLHDGLGGDTMIAHVGADLFSWLMERPAGSPLAPLQERCRALQESVTVPLRLASGARLSACCGIALAPEHARSAELLLQYSDNALQRARMRGAGTLQVYDPALRTATSHHRELHQALRQALEREQLELRYQPIIALRGGLMGVEASVHWTGPDGQPVSQNQVVSLLQSEELLQSFTDWELGHYRRQMAEWQARGLAIPSVALELLPQQLRLPGIEERLLHDLCSESAPEDCVLIEVSESSMLDGLENTASLLRHLREHGIRLAVDDFGTGYASPSYLRTLPVDVLKIDGLFLRDVPQQPEARSVLDGLITVGLSMDMTLIAEGVDTKAQAEYLAGRNVVGAQGNYFGDALPAAELEAWLQTRQLRAA